MAEEREIAISTAFADGKTPSRCELLSMVRKHSNLLGKVAVDEQDASDIEMDAQFWREMLDLYFINDRVSNACQEDDLIFFVRNMNLHRYGFNDGVQDLPPFYVRRRAPKVSWPLLRYFDGREPCLGAQMRIGKLEKVLGDDSADVDWRASFYLNLIAHTSYTVTVAICSIEDLRKYQAGEVKFLSPVYKVVKTVYASPSRVNFHLNFKKDAETLPAYPNICFAVDDFDDTFGAVVLSERDHCYCVLLNAHGGAAYPEEKVLQDHNYCSNLENENDSERAKLPKLTLFSGFVSYQMVREAYDAGKSRFGSLLSIGYDTGKKDRLLMRGPGGRGEVEVAVSGISDQSLQNSSPSLVQISKRGLGMDLGNIAHKAASTASMLAKQAFAAASTHKRSDAELLPLRCCLMSISLPWDHIAHDLLWKGSSLINI